MSHVLLSCVGRQSDLVDWFVEAAGAKRHVFAMDADLSAPALQGAHMALPAPTASRDDYAEAVLEHCRRYDIGMVLTLHEAELALLEAARPRFQGAGVVLLGSPAHEVATFRDKLRLHEALCEAGLPSPDTRLARAHAADFWTRRLPLFGKPRWGRGSIGATPVRTRNELEALLRRAEHEDLLLQPLIDGDEYGLDLVHDLQGRHRATLARHKMRMRKGETDRARSLCDPELEALGERLGRWTRHLGLFDVDVLRSATGRPLIIDINPRFGGGYAFSHRAGANVPEALLRWLDGDERDELIDALLSPRPGIVAQRESRVVTVSEPTELVPAPAGRGGVPRTGEMAGD